MKKKLYIALAAGMFCMTLATGCEDRLNIAKHGDVGSQETYYQTDDEAEAAAAALYLSSDHNITTGSLSRICYQMICILAEVHEVTMEKWNV